MALPSNAFDLLASSHIVEDPKAKDVFEAAEAKRRDEAKEAARKRKEAERKKKEQKEKAERRRKEEEKRASTRRWFESQELEKNALGAKSEEGGNQKICEENQRKQKEEDEKLREENPEKWEAEMKRRQKEGLKAAVLGLLRHPSRFSSSPSREFQRREPGYKKGQVQKRVQTTLSNSSVIGSVSGYSTSTATTRPSTSDQTQGSLRSEAAKNNGLAVKVKDNGTDGEGWQVVSSRRRRNQGTYNATPAISTPVTTTVPVVPTKENVVGPATKPNGEKGHMSSTSVSSERSHYNGNGKVTNGSGRKYYANGSGQWYNGNDSGQRYYSKKKQAKPKPFIDADGWQVVQNRRRVYICGAFRASGLA